MPPPNRLRSIALLAQANVLVAGTSFLAGVLLARALGPEGRGVFANLVLWPTLICYPAMLGIHMELGRRTAQTPGTARVNYRTGGAILAVTSAAAMLVYAAIAALYADRSGGHDALTLALLAGLMIPFGIWNVFQMQMELGRQKPAMFSFVRAVFAGANLAAVAVMWLAGARSVLAYLVAFLLANVLSSFITAVVIFRDIQAEGADKSTAKPAAVEVVKAAWPFAVSTVVNLLSTSLDRILVSAFFPARNMGLYVVALAISQIQDLVGEAIAQLFFAKSAQSKSIGDMDKGWLALRLRQTMAIYMILCLGTLAVAPFLLRILFGEKFEDSVSLVYLLLPILALKGATRPFEEVLKGGGRPLLQARINSAMTVVFAVAGGLSAWAGNLPLMLLALFAATAGGLVGMAMSVAGATGLRLVDVLVPRPADVMQIAGRLVEVAMGLLRRGS